MEPLRLGRGLNLGDEGEALRRALYERIKSDTELLIPNTAVIKSWFDEFAVDIDVNDEAEGGEAVEEEDEGATVTVRGRALPAAAVEPLLRRVWAHAEPALASSAPLHAAARRAFEDVVGDCIAEVDGAPVTYRYLIDNPLGCVHEALWKLIKQDD
jgi:hypothetical protein